MAAVAWLHRRAGFGLHPIELDDLAAAGPDAALAAMVAEGDEAIVDPWADVVLEREPSSRRQTVISWLRHFIATDQPFSDRRTWMLHGWLVSSLGTVNHPQLMADQIRLLRSSGGGDYAELLRSITIDAAMLVYLDGRSSTAEAPNENYGRELLELFSLGVGNYTEDDVKAASRALTGWVVSREPFEVRFVPRRHDDTPVTLLGDDAVHDVDSVIDAIVTQPAHARFVADRIAREYLGDPTDPRLEGAVDELADAYDASGRRIDAVIERALRMGLDERRTSLVRAPVPWLVGSLRTCNVDIRRLGREQLQALPQLGQTPLLPPDVSGWPTGATWFTSSSMVARTGFAHAIAAATPPGEPILVALDDGDLDLAARRLGLAEPFGPSTADAIRSQSDPVNRLTLALVCPENLLA